MRRLVVYLSPILIVAFAMMLGCAILDSNDNPSDGASCDLDDLLDQTVDLCGNPTHFTKIVDSAEECGLTCSENEIPYWYEEFGHCPGACFCCDLGPGEDKQK